MALNQFYFSIVRSAEFAEASTAIVLAGQYLKAQLRDHEYGTGVACVIVFVSLLERDEPAHFGRRSAYEPGKRIVETDGVEYEIENALKIFIAPNVTSIRSATTIADVIECVKRAFLAEKQDVLALHIPNFDMQRFFSDLIVELDELIKQPLMWHRFGRMGRLSRGALDHTDGEDRPPFTDFPAAVLAFVERELPAVNEAARRKDRKAIVPLIGRMNEFIQPWAGMTAAKGAIFDIFPDCAHLVADLGREIAIECDSQLADVERERLHLEFQRRLARCRECVDRVKDSSR